MAIDWLNRPHQKPWLLILGHKAPHSFYTAEDKYAHSFDGVEVRYPGTAFHLEGKPDWIKQRLYTWHGIYGPLFDWRKNFPDDRPEGVKEFAAMTHACWGTILSVDDSVGTLRATLDRMRQLDDTLILFLGDNGLFNGEHGMVDKRTMHEPSIRIPLAARYPGLVRPNRRRRVEAMVLTVDLAPTILDVCRVSPLATTHGRSWKTLVTQDDPAWRRSFFYEYNYEKQFPYTPNIRGVRTDDWKYIHYPHGDGGPDRHNSELYDLRHDSEERHNLIDDPGQADRIHSLKSELARLEHESGLIHDMMPIDEGIKQVLPDQKIR
jgi:N-acetylglucosamine-6-sulfatase